MVAIEAELFRDPIPLVFSYSSFTTTDGWMTYAWEPENTSTLARCSERIKTTSCQATEDEVQRLVLCLLTALGGRLLNRSDTQLSRGRGTLQNNRGWVATQLRSPRGRESR